MVGELVQDLLDELVTSQEHSPEVLSAVEAQIDVLRACYIRARLLQDLLNQMTGDAGGGRVAAFLHQLSRADRYERRALSRRKFAVRDLTRVLKDLSVSSASDESRSLLTWGLARGIAEPTLAFGQLRRCFDQHQAHLEL
jgi:hypothetical protein